MKLINRTTRRIVAGVSVGSVLALGGRFTSWDALAAADYLDRPEWTWETTPDPLAE